MKTLSFKIEDELHQGLKIGAVMEGRPIAEILKELIRQWVKGRDPFLHTLKNMPITKDEEEISPTTLKAIRSALKEKSDGTWEELSKELPTRRKE
jgi:hypothetical protein